MDLSDSWKTKVPAILFVGDWDRRAGVSCEAGGRSGIPSVFIYPEWQGKSACSRRQLYIGERQLMLSGSGVPHEYYPLEENHWTTCWIVFRGEYLTEMMKGLGFIDFAYEKDAVNEKIEKLFHQLLGAAKDPLYGDEYCSVLIYEYIMSIRQTMMEHKKYSGLGDKDILQHAVIYMNENYASDITLEELAEIGGVTKQHFCRVFKEQMKMRPMEYLARRRMASARNLLLTTTKSIAEIGEAVGYDNPTYFGMVFKKYEGITPTDCRKRHGTSLTW